MSARVLRVTGASAVWSPGLESADVSTVECVDGRIAAAPDDAAAAPDGAAVVETLDADGGVVTPGLVNAHHHLLQLSLIHI